jgi:hypothetical protein
MAFSRRSRPYGRLEPGRLSSQKAWKVKILDKELTDALTAGKGVIRVRF